MFHRVRCPCYWCSVSMFRFPWNHFSVLSLSLAGRCMVCFVVSVVGSMWWDLLTPSVLVLYVFWCFSLVPITL
ncbi:hypothetical protein EDD85DRAFT_849062 [Armillaria nabsnona]|nr:hypothetical protein EDD85DRAFT_849062 [Armillaria nabsnona]